MNPAVLLILASAAAALAPPLAPVPVVHDIDWRSSPLDLNLRGLNGERFRFRCPPGKPAAGTVIGSGPYTDGSAICAAAVHAGQLRPAIGGEVTIEIRPGISRYIGSESHYMRSASLDSYWSGSFVVTALQDPQSVPPAGGQSPSTPQPAGAVAARSR
jgi:hypothetical protein